MKIPYYDECPTYIPIADYWEMEEIFSELRLRSPSTQQRVNFEMYIYLRSHPEVTEEKALETFVNHARKHNVKLWLIIMNRPEIMESAYVFIRNTHLQVTE